MSTNNQIENSFSHYSCVEYEYDGKECTDSHCGCKDGSYYCTRNTYQGLRIVKVDLDGVRNHFSRKNSSEFFEYCVDRLLRIYKVYDCENWTLNRHAGYYGEEVGDAELDGSLFTKIVEKINHLSSLPPDEQIRCVLQEEYQKLLPQLVKCKFEKIKIDVSNVYIPNKEYHKKIIDTESYYKEFTLPLGIYLQENGGEKYRLIDGYHIYCAFMSQDRIPKKVTIIAAI